MGVEELLELAGRQRTDSHAGDGFFERNPLDKAQMTMGWYATVTVLPLHDAVNGSIRVVVDRLHSGHWAAAVRCEFDVVIRVVDLTESNMPRRRPG